MSRTMEMRIFRARRAVVTQRKQRTYVAGPSRKTKRCGSEHGARGVLFGFFFRGLHTVCFVSCLFLRVYGSLFCFVVLV